MINGLYLRARNLWEDVRNREEGATAVEYGLMVALIAAIIIGAVTFLGRQLNTIFCNVVSALGGRC